MRTIADKRVVDQCMPGESIVFNLYNDLATAPTPLTETVDPTPVAVPDTDTVTVTLNEYGNTTLTTRKLRLFSFSDIDPAIANLVAYNQLNTLDEVVRDVLRQGTNVTRLASGSMAFDAGSTARDSAGDTVESQLIRASVAMRRGRSVMPKVGSAYLCLVPPDVSYDLRSEAGGWATWREPYEQVAPGPIWAGMIGQYEGAVFIETPRTYFAAAGDSNAVVHRSIMVGQQALAEAVAEEPHIVFGPVVDSLNRMRPVGWYGVLGWARYREQAIQRIETSSSLA